MEVVCKWVIWLAWLHHRARSLDPLGVQIEYAICIGFKVIALLTDLRVATGLEVKSLDAYSDSQLVVNQVQGEYLIKDPCMMAYLDEVKATSMEIKDFKIRQISIEEDKQVEALAKLALAFDSSRIRVSF